MQALLSFEQAPPLSAPLRFFLTAPLFAMLAGGLLLWSGPSLFESRWNPATLALTHLITAGFMLQVMLGALQQLLPVVAGANLAKPLSLAVAVHGCITIGALSLVAAFLWKQAFLFAAAAVLLGGGVAMFIGAAGHALWGLADTTRAVVRGLHLALLGLLVTVLLGVLLSLAQGRWLSVPTLAWIDIHLIWGFIGWGGMLLAAVSLTIVPMFQQTPAFPRWFERRFCVGALSVLVLWSVPAFAQWESAAALLAFPVALVPVVLALSTWAVQRRSKRATPDASGRLWRLAMFNALLACALWLGTHLSPALAARFDAPLLIGVLVLFGVFMSVMVAMLYKIVPFLVWLHCQNRGKGRLVAPNMKKVLAQRQIDGQAIAHGLTFCTLMLAVLWPQEFAYPAGVGLILSNAWLLVNLLSALRVFRRHMEKLQTIAAQPTPSRHS